MSISDLKARRLAAEIRERFYSPLNREGIVAVVMDVLRANRVIPEADCMRVIAFLNGTAGRNEASPVDAVAAPGNSPSGKESDDRGVPLADGTRAVKARAGKSSRYRSRVGRP